MCKNFQKNSDKKQTAKDLHTEHETIHLSIQEMYTYYQNTDINNFDNRPA
jgi:hypothetical protein